MRTETLEDGKKKGTFTGQTQRLAFYPAEFREHGKTLVRTADLGVHCDDLLFRSSDIFVVLVDVQGVLPWERGRRARDERDIIVASIALSLISCSLKEDAEGDSMQGVFTFARDARGVPSAEMDQSYRLALVGPLE